MLKQNTAKEDDFQLVISASKRKIDLHIRETFRYKDLIFLFVKRDFISYYKQTILGPLWAIIQPLLTTIVFTIVFGRLAGLTTADVAGEYVLPGFLFYMSGTICWSYFSGTLNATSGTFINNRATMGKVYYPRLVAPISTAISGLISFGIQFVMLMVFILYYMISGGTSIHISAAILLLPLAILQMMLLATGCGIIISSVTTKYRDLAMLVGFGLQLWQYGSPIAYGLQLVPEGLRGYYLLNPVTSIVTTFRYALFGFGYFDLWYFLGSWVFTLAMFIIGLFMFSRIERTFIDTI